MMIALLLAAAVSAAAAGSLPSQQQQPAGDRLSAGMAGMARSNTNSSTTTTSSRRSRSLVCPAVPPAPSRLLLEVHNANLSLPDGTRVPGLTFNRSYIGPLLRASLGEELSVDVVNAADVGTSVHWHGADLPNASWADGVAGVSQAPIPPGATFRYKFKAEPAGTLWYHSHTGMQFGDGLRGPLIVEDPDDPHSGAYDEEVVLLLTDQGSETGERELQALQEGTAKMAMGACGNVTGQDISDAPFTTILTNGKGFMPRGGNSSSSKAVGSPFVIRVHRGRRYRFRAIQGAASWGLKVKPRKHNITVIALDGANVAPTNATGFVFTPGERVDFILHANQPVGAYWIDIATLTGQVSPALLLYEGANARSAGEPQLSLGCEWARDEPGVLDFKNRTMAPHASTPPAPARADQTLVAYLTNNAAPDQSRESVLGNQSIPGMRAAGVTSQVGCRPLPDGRPSAYCWTLNWVEFEGAANGRPLLFPGARRAAGTYVQRVPLGAVVDVVLINPGAMLHPMHLHGQRFWVMGVGNGEILHANGSVRQDRLVSPRLAILRDTQPVANAVPRQLQQRVAATAGSPAPPAPAAGSGHGRRLRQGGAGMGDSMAGMAMPGMDMPQAGGMAPAAASTPAGGNMASTASPAHSSPRISAPAGAGMAPVAAGSSPPHGGAAGGASLAPGYAVIRFKADNPGVWSFHCHIDLHANSGMFMVFEVAPEQAALPPGVQTCANPRGSSALLASNATGQPAPGASAPSTALPSSPQPARSGAGAGTGLTQLLSAAFLAVVATVAPVLML